jgi:hypothetical protein
LRLRSAASVCFTFSSAQRKNQVAKKREHSHKSTPRHACRCGSTQPLQAPPSAHCPLAAGVLTVEVHCLPSKRTQETTAKVRAAYRSLEMYELLNASTNPDECSPWNVCKASQDLVLQVYPSQTYSSAAEVASRPGTNLQSDSYWKQRACSDCSTHHVTRDNCPGMCREHDVLPSPRTMSLSRRNRPTWHFDDHRPPRWLWSGPRNHKKSSILQNQYLASSVTSKYLQSENLRASTDATIEVRLCCGGAESPATR